MCFHFLSDLCVTRVCDWLCYCVVIFNLLFDNSIYNFVSDIFLIRSGHVSDGGVKMRGKCCFITVACISAVLNLPGHAFEGRKLFCNRWYGEVFHLTLSVVVSVVCSSAKHRWREADTTFNLPLVIWCLVFLGPKKSTGIDQQPSDLNLAIIWLRWCRKIA